MATASHGGCLCHTIKRKKSLSLSRPVNLNINLTCKVLFCVYFCNFLFSHIIYFLLFFILFFLSQFPLLATGLPINVKKMFLNLFQSGFFSCFTYSNIYCSSYIATWKTIFLTSNQNYDFIPYLVPLQFSCS